MELKRYIVVANRFGYLGVTVKDGYEPQPGDAILYSSDTVDGAFDWKEHMDARIAQLNGVHCVTCEG